MKLSVDVPSPLNQRAKIFVDGKEYTSVIEADEEAGYIIYYPRDPVTGSLMANASMDAAISVRIEGKVEIKFADDLLGNNEELAK